MMQSLTIRALTDEENSTLNRLLERLAAREPRNHLRASYYDGKRAMQQLTKVVPPHYYTLGIVLGWTAKAVDSLARRCNLDGFVWPDGDLDDLGGRELWDANHFGSEVSSAIVSALLHGPAFLVNTRGLPGEPKSLIHVKDARSATGDWNGRARRMENLLSVIARDDDGQPKELALYLNGVTVTATKDSLGRWSVERTPHPWGVPAEPLVYKPRVGRPFGSSRITRPAMALQDQATRALIRMEGHLDVYSFPEMWMLGADETIFRDADGNVKPSWQVMLGRIKGVPDDPEAENPRAEVKQFPGSDPSPNLAALNAFAKLFAREMSMPDSALAITDVSNPTSAESYDASQYELIAEAEGATDDWGPALRRSFARGLAIQNGETSVPPEWLSIDAKWRNPRYLARSAEADAGMKQIAAVPRLADTEVGLELLGLTEQQIVRVQADLRRAQGPSVLDRLRSAAGGGQPAE